MFVGHYGVSFAAQRMNRDVPLWVLFIAVQLLDVFWAPLRAGPKAGLMVFGIVMLGTQAIVFFGPPPPSDAAAAITALLAYGLFAAFVARWEARHRATSGGAA